MTEEVWITGYGIVCAAGADRDACWSRLSAGKPLVERHPRYGHAHHPIREFDRAEHVPKRADQRQMGELMHYAVAAASRALTAARVSAGAANLEICVVSRAGERDVALDETVLAAVAAGADGAGVNRELMKMRPSLFLAQLPNLVPSNICIVRGIAAPSRTLMGTECTGVDALGHCAARIRTGQGSMFLVGGTCNSACVHQLAPSTACGWVRHEPCRSVWGDGGTGYCLGSASAFVVIESRRHAEARGAGAVARVQAAVSSFTPRDDKAGCSQRLFARWRERETRPGEIAVISGVSGDGSIAAMERAFLASIEALGCKVSARAPARILGHSVEASFFTNLVVALFCLERGELPPPFDRSERFETTELSAPIRRALVTSWGSSGGEGLAIVERPS